MKTLRNTVITAMVLLISFSCDQSHEEAVDNLKPEESQGSHFRKFWKRKKRILPFYAKFVTRLTPTDETSDCNPPYVFFNNQEGKGQLAIFGGFTARLTFCFNPKTLKYVDTDGTFTMENGDKIFVADSDDQPGQVIPSDRPKYDLEFKDKSIITGGTGRFEGASGWVRIYGFTKQLPEGGDMTDHRWFGRIVLKQKHRGRRKWLN